MDTVFNDFGLNLNVTEPNSTTLRVNRTTSNVADIFNRRNMVILDFSDILISKIVIENQSSIDRDFSLTELFLIVEIRIMMELWIIWIWIPKTMVV